MDMYDWIRLLFYIAIPGGLLVTNMWATISLYERGQKWHYTAFWTMFWMLVLQAGSLRLNLD